MDQESALRHDQRRHCLPNRNRHLRFQTTRPPNEAITRGEAGGVERHLEEIGHDNAIETTRSLESEVYAVGPNSSCGA
jgi:hypothetical protein